MKEYNAELHRQRVSKSLIGLIGEKARRWKGNDASYAAKHLWIVKHYGKASYCENNPHHKAKRFEWANISGKYRRDREDYRPLCPSCHRKEHKGNYCKRGHEFTPENTYITPKGWRQCKICRKEHWRKDGKQNN